MKITIAANVYPPEIGGPSEYSRQLFETFSVQNHEVIVITYEKIKKYSTGVRHFLYFCKLCIESRDTEYIIAMDTFSVALPAVVFAKLFRKKIVLRVAGDFLWEMYAERVRQPIILSEFYSVPRAFTFKEKIVFKLTRTVLRASHCIVFSTEWQRAIWMKPYALTHVHTTIIENLYAPVFLQIETRNQSQTPKVFLSPSRDRFIKNKKTLERAFAKVSAIHPHILLDTKIVSHEVLDEKMSCAYAVVVPSLSEVSPNLVLDALSYGVPSIVTKDTGIYDRIQGMVVFVDPTSEDSIRVGLESILTPEVYDACVETIKKQSYTHSWNEIAQEFIDVYNSLK